MYDSTGEEDFAYRLSTKLNLYDSTGEEDFAYPLSAKLNLYDSAYGSGYGSYGGQAEPPPDGVASIRQEGYVSFEDPVLRAQEASVRPEEEGDLVFNSKWQSEIEKLLFHGPDEFSYESISDLSTSFIKRSEHFAKTIIMELESPIKTIREVSSFGILGGKKFVVGGVFFKLAEDPLGIGATNACKVAGLELKSVTAILNAAQNLQLKLFVPFSCVIDYLGFRCVFFFFFFFFFFFYFDFRLIAMAVAPLRGERTLIAGSQDGGKNIRSDPVGDDLLSRIAKELNVAPHYVQGKLIPIAVDTELHRGTDGRLYLVDLSRALAPETPRRDLGKHPHLYRVLRPELVRRNPTPLCSDAFSGFLAKSSDRMQFDADCVSATKRLFSFAVPWSALLVDQLFGSRGEHDSFFSLESLHRIRNIIHSLGVNMRYLSNVFRRCKQTVAQQLLLVEMVSRSCKWQLRSVMRRCAGGSGFDRILEKMVVRMCNEFLNGATDIWDDVARDLQDYFGKVDVNMLSGSQLLEEMVQIPNFSSLIFERISESLGLSWSERAKGVIANSSLSEKSSEKVVKKKNRTSTSRSQSLRHIGKSSHQQNSPTAANNTSIPPGSLKKLLFIEDVEVSVRTKTTRLE